MLNIIKLSDPENPPDLVIAGELDTLTFIRLLVFIVTTLTY